MAPWHSLGKLHCVGLFFTLPACFVRKLTLRAYHLFLSRPVLCAVQSTQKVITHLNQLLSWKNRISKLNLSLFKVTSYAGQNAILFVAIAAMFRKWDNYFCSVFFIMVTAWQPLPVEWLIANAIWPCVRRFGTNLRGWFRRKWDCLYVWRKQDRSKRGSAERHLLDSSA